MDIGTEEANIMLQGKKSRKFWILEDRAQILGVVPYHRIPEERSFLVSTGNLITKQRSGLGPLL